MLLLVLALASAQDCRLVWVDAVEPWKALTLPLLVDAVPLSGRKVMPTWVWIAALLELEENTLCVLHFIFQSYAQPSLQYLPGQQIFSAPGVVVQPATAVTTVVAPGQPPPLQPVSNLPVVKMLVLVWLLFLFCGGVFLICNFKLTDLIFLYLALNFWRNTF